MYNFDCGRAERAQWIVLAGASVAPRSGLEGRDTQTQSLELGIPRPVQSCGRTRRTVVISASEPVSASVPRSGRTKNWAPGTHDLYCLMCALRDRDGMKDAAGGAPPAQGKDDTASLPGRAAPSSVPVTEEPAETGEAGERE